MKTLTIRLLGFPEVVVGQQTLSFRTRKVLALLIYIVVEKGMHSRESLMTLLWPESPPDNAAATLRGALSRLRKSLLPGGKFLLSDGGKIGFDFDASFNLDLDWLASAALPHGSIDMLIPGLKHDRGGFLDGFSLPDAPAFDNWAATQRGICQRQLEAVFDRLTQHQLANREIKAAVETAARWTARAPLSEAAYRRLMAAQALEGNRPAALTTYEECRSFLRKEFGIEPSRQTAVLADQISRDNIHKMPAGTIYGRPATVGTSIAPGSPRLALPFVGRRDEHSRLVTVFRHLHENGVCVAIVIGAAGVGKTSLVNAFRDWLSFDSPAAEYWLGRAFELGGQLPYQPVIEAMRLRLDQENAPEDLLDDVWLAELSQLIPELRARYPDLPAPMSGNDRFVRSRLFEAISTLGNVLATRNAAVFVLEDIQWADLDTLDMIHYLARRWSESNAPILLLLTVRQEDIAARAPLRDWLTRLGRDVPIEQLLMNALSGTAVNQLVLRLSDPAENHEATQTFATWLWAETRGLPFFLEALLQMLVEQGILARTDAAGRYYDFASALSHVKSVAMLPIPPGIREIIQARLQRLPVDAIALLLAASVLGRDCTLERLCQVSDTAEANALHALEELLNGRLLIEIRGGRRPYALAHDYIRQVVYSGSREASRRLFHRRALLALEADRAPAAECAFHALAAMLDEPAFRYSLLAGDEALASWSFEESRLHYDRAKEIAERMLVTGAPIDPHALLRLFENRGRALTRAEDYPAAQAHYEEMRDLARTRQDTAMELAALSAQCIIHATHTPVFNPRLARELGQSALDLSKAQDNRVVEARALWGMMLVELYAGGSSVKTADYGRRSLDLARELGMQEQVGHVLVNLCWPYIAQKKLISALEANKEAETIWRTMGNLPLLLETYDMRQFILYTAGDHEDLIEASRQALNLSREIGNQAYQGNALRFLGDTYRVKGRLGLALTNIEAAMSLSEATGNPYSQHGDYHSLMHFYLAAGALEVAEQWSDRLYDALQQGSMPVFQSFFLAGIALVKIALGRLDDGQEMLNQALGAYDWEAPWSNSLIPISVAEAHLQLARQKPERVFDREDQLQQLQEAGFLSLQAELLWLRGRAWLDLGDMAMAQEVLLEAQQVAEKKGEHTILWQVLATRLEVASMLGALQLAEMIRKRLREVASSISEQAGSDARRASFRAQPILRRALD